MGFGARTIVVTSGRNSRTTSKPAIGQPVKVAHRAARPQSTKLPPTLDPPASAAERPPRAPP